MRISDWSSDVCSSDLEAGAAPALRQQQAEQAIFLKRLVHRRGRGAPFFAFGGFGAKQGAQFPGLGDIAFSQLRRTEASNGISLAFRRASHWFILSVFAVTRPHILSTPFSSRTRKRIQNAI